MQQFYIVEVLIGDQKQKTVFIEEYEVVTFVKRLGNANVVDISKIEVNFGFPVIKEQKLVCKGSIIKLVDLGVDVKDYSRKEL